MAITYGVTATGFVMKPYTEILAEVSAQLQATFGNTINLDPSQPFGQWAAIQADREFLLWQLVQACYTARDPDGAQGQGLVELCAITGTIPFSPSASTVTATLVGTAATVIPINTVFSTTPAGVQFKTSVATTLGSAPPSWATGLYAPHAVISSGGNIYITLVGGTATGGNAPVGTTFGLAITGSDGVTWYFLGTGTGLINVLCNSLVLGPQNCNLWTLNTIVTPVAGLNNVTNYTVQVNGQALETDTALRTRRYVQLARNSSGNVAAITAALSALTTSQGAQVLTSEATYENDTDTTDAFGLPPHSIQSVVSYGTSPQVSVAATDQLIANTIYATKAAGVQTKGAQALSVTDANGTVHPINFDYPTSVPLVVNITLYPNPLSSGVQYIGDAALQTALNQWISGQSYNGANILLEDGSGFPGYSAGQTIFAGQIATAVMEGAYGVVDVSSVTTQLNGGVTDNTPKLLSRTQIPLLPVTFNITHSLV